MTLRALIADDEPLALQRLRIALDKMPDLEIVGAAKDGAEALELIASTSPDIVFLDIKMPKLTGLGLVDAMDETNPPVVIFVSAYGRYAVEAFREGAIDYLMKPLDEERLATAVKRARSALLTRNAEQRIAELRDAVAALRKEAERQEEPQYDRDLWISARSEVVRVPMQQVLWFGVDGDYVIVHTAECEYLIHESLRDLEKRLDPRMFLRVHRSAIVRTDAIAALEKLPFSSWQLRLTSGQSVGVSRSCRKAVENIVSIRR